MKGEVGMVKAAHALADERSRRPWLLVRVRVVLFSILAVYLYIRMLTIGMFIL